MILNGYHIYTAYQKTKEPDADWFVPTYYKSVDHYWNYFYVVVLGVWSTVYIESWKRKQNTLKYMWASDQRMSDITSAEKREQVGATWLIEAVSGKQSFRVLYPTPIRNAIITICLLLFFSAVAFFIWLLCMPLLGMAIKQVLPSNSIAVFRT